MATYMEVYDYTPDLLDRIIADVDENSEKLIIKKTIEMFCDAGLTIKVKHLFPNTLNAYYRIMCFIKKSAEAVIINTRTDIGKEGVINGHNIQIRICNQNTLDNLDQLNESIRNQIINAQDCRFCSNKCVGKRYVFTYNNTEYTKCQYLCSNFRIIVDNEEDVNSVIDIIRAEISYKKPKRKA